MSTVVGDIEVKVGLAEEDLLRGQQRFAQAMQQMSKQVEQFGAVMDKVMARSEGETKGLVAANERLVASENKATEAAHRHGEAQKSAAGHAHDHSSKNMQLAMSLQQVAFMAAAVTAAVGLMAKNSLDAYKEEEAAFKGLESVAQRTIGTFTGAKDAVQSLTQDGLLTLAEASKAVQAGLASGFSLDETMNLIKTFKDSAAFNRQAGLEFGESVVRAMEGVRMGNSVLADAAGITKNLSMILKEAGKSEQDLQRVTSDSSVRRALYNGLLKEGALFAGNAAEAAETLAGAEARAATATRQAAATMGESLAPIAEQFAEVVASVAGKIADWIKQNPELARTLLLVVGALTTTVAALSTAAIAVAAFGAAISVVGGPITLAVAGISALVAVITGVSVAAAATRREQDRLNSSTTQLMRQYDALRTAIDGGTLSTEEKERAQSKLKDTIEKLIELNPQMRDWFGEEGKLVDGVTEKWKNQLSVLLDLEKAKQRAILQESVSGINDLQKQKEGVAQKIRDKYAGQSPATGGAGEQGQYIPITEGSMEGGWGEFGPYISPAQSGPAKADPGKVEREIAIATINIERDIASLQKKYDDAQDYLDRLDSPMTKDEALGPPPKTDPPPTTDPKELERKQAEAFSSALKLQALNEQLAAANDKPLTPEQVSESLKKIRAQFADYLKAHPEEALALDVEIAQEDQKTRQAAAKALKDKLAAQRQAIQENESFFGDTYRQNGMRGALQEALGTAQLMARSSDRATADEGAKAVLELSKALRDLDASLQKANFEQKFEAIGKSREQALAGMAGTLHQLSKDLIDAEAAEASADTPEKREAAAARVKSIKEQQIALSRQVLEAQQADLQKLLEDETLTADQRAQVERELVQTKRDLYDLDTQSHRLATEAKVAAERQAAEEKEKLIRQEQEWLRDLADADLKRLRNQHREEEQAARDRIKAIQDQLQALERKWAKEDARKRVQDIESEIANVKGQLTHQKVDENGNLVYTYDEERVAELEKQLEEEKTQQARDQQRQRLQDQLEAAQDALATMQEEHQRQEEARAEFWQNLQALDLAGYADLTAAAEQGLGAWVQALSTKFGEAVSAAQSKAAEIAAAVESVNAALSNLSGFTAPTLPASLPGSTGAGNSSTSVGQVVINNTFPNATNPQQVAQAVTSSAESGLAEALVATGSQYRRTKAN